MPSSETYRRQQRNVYPGQISTPGQLREGQDIACLSVLPGNSIVNRGILAVTRFLIAANLRGASPREQVAAAVGGWRTEADRSFTTLWRGEVDVIGKIGISVVLTHGRLGVDFDGVYVPGQLPALAGADKQPKLFAYYEEMGLTPIPDGSPDAGRWLPYITVAMDDS